MSNKENVSYIGHGQQVIIRQLTGDKMATFGSVRISAAGIEFRQNKQAWAGPIPWHRLEAVCEFFQSPPDSTQDPEGPDPQRESDGPLLEGME